VVRGASELRDKETVAVGVGMAGLVRWPAGVFAWGPHLPGTEMGARQQLQQEWSLPVVVDNDVNCAALAELEVGAAIGVRHGVMITIGTGIGGGLIVDGRIYRGSSFAGELGHMTMVPNGEPCHCGHRGCWETLVADATVQPFLREARAGGVTANARLTEAGRWLGRGLVNVIAILDPATIVLGGGVISAASDLLLPVAIAEIGANLPGGVFRSEVAVKVAEAGPWAGALGAAMLARGEFR
ncbi:MAG TPA: ROK family protein, partial [Acidimicrobiia bacterium]|nr:ROK family protein [Acidimicrobiia bacterium]